MDRLSQLETLVAVVQSGSLTAAAKLEGVSPAVLSRRLDALERRLGVRLLTRTTRRLTLTAEGEQFVDDGQRILRELEAAEAAATEGQQRATGQLRITAPAGFGRTHVAPLIAPFSRMHPDLRVSLELSDRLADLIADQIDIAIRIGRLHDARLVAVRLADNHRVIVCSPGYAQRRGVPRHPDELAQHDCLTLGNWGNPTRTWELTIDGQPRSVRVGGFMECNDGTVLHAWALDGQGVALRSMWEVGRDLAEGRLIQVLENFVAPGHAIYALHAPGAHQSPRVRLFLDYIRECFTGAATPAPSAAPSPRSSSSS